MLPAEEGNTVGGLLGEVRIGSVKTSLDASAGEGTEWTEADVEVEARLGSKNLECGGDGWSDSEVDAELLDEGLEGCLRYDGRAGTGGVSAGGGEVMPCIGGVRRPPTDACLGVVAGVVVLGDKNRFLDSRLWALKENVDSDLGRSLGFSTSSSLSRYVKSSPYS